MSLHEIKIKFISIKKLTFKLFAIDFLLLTGRFINILIANFARLLPDFISCFHLFEPFWIFQNRTENLPKKNRVSGTETEILEKSDI